MTAQYYKSIYTELCALNGYDGKQDKESINLTHNDNKDLLLGLKRSKSQMLH